MNIGAILLELFPTTMLVVNWIISLCRTPNSSAFFKIDLKQLGPDSLPFLKTQWPFVAICLVGSSFAQIQAMALLKERPDFTLGVTLASAVSAGIQPILKLFFVSYLAAPKYPGRLATIGIWSVLVYVMSAGLLSSFTKIGFFILIVPGLILVTRTCLFLPIYALEGHHPLPALQKSWALTEGQYWMVSRYMGLPAILVSLVSVLPSLVIAAEVYGKESYKSYFSILAACEGVSMILGLVIAGISYKLYDRLTTIAEPQDS